VEGHLLPAENNDVGVEGQKDGSSLRSTSDVLHNIRDLLETRLRSDAQLRLQTHKNQQSVIEWLIAAAVIDRICFIVFSFIFVVGTALLFVLAMSREH